jgi:predicted amidohydrolase
MRDTALTIAVVQFAPRFGQKSGNLERIRRLLQTTRADIIVLPELCTTGYFFLRREEVGRLAETADGPTADFFLTMARERDAVIAAGFAERQQDRLYNACLIAIPGAEAVQVYRKTHLFYKERLCFDAGDTGFFVVEDPLRQVRIGPMVCYDWRFPEAARSLALLGADVIVCPANLITEAWRQVLPARAVENKIYLAVSNRTGSERRGREVLHFKGSSAIYGYDGGLLARADAVAEGVFSADIEPRATRDKSFNAFNDVFRDRRPEHYRRLVSSDPVAGSRAKAE